MAPLLVRFLIWMCWHVILPIRLLLLRCIVDLHIPFFFRYCLHLFLVGLSHSMNAIKILRGGRGYSSGLSSPIRCWMPLRLGEHNFFGHWMYGLPLKVSSSSTSFIPCPF